MWGLINHSGPSMVDTLEGECCVPETSVNTLQMWCGRPSGCSDPFVWEKVCFGDSGDWQVWQVPVNLVEDALRMVSLEELQDASLCWRSKRTVAPYEWQRGWLLGYCHYWATTWEGAIVNDSCTNHWQMQATINGWHQPINAATILAYK